MKLKNKNNIPKHIAIIMDGNGRLAKQKGLPRLVGHQNGVKAVRKIIESCNELGVQYLTLYTFSEENWNRPIDEVSGLMNLFVKSLKAEIKKINDNNIRFTVIGNISNIEEKIKNEILDSISQTKKNTGLTLNLAFNYSGRKEIVNMVKNILTDSNSRLLPSDINDELIESYLYTSNMPDPDFLIRTGGEFRISNFLLWQIAYSELYFSEKLWPDFNKKDLNQAISDLKKEKEDLVKLINTYSKKIIFLQS